MADDSLLATLLTAVCIALICVSAVLIKTATQRTTYHRNWCIERLNGGTIADTVAIIRDDKFCARVVK